MPVEALPPLPATDMDDGEDRKSLKKQKKEYKDEKKRVTAELVSALRDPTVVVMADYLKVRGTLRKWNRYYCVLKPGLMLIYKNNKTEKHGNWMGTILLNVCELIERPSKKDGFCFKLFHPLDQNIWATRGPLGESHGAVTLNPMPATHLICRASSVSTGQCWMDALELSLTCSGLLMRTMHKLSDGPKKEEAEQAAAAQKDTDSLENMDLGDKRISETEAEKHFDGLDDQEEANVSDQSELLENGEPVGESNYVRSEPEQFGQLGEGAQTEEVGEENKSLVWTLLKQVRPGMDLSKVVLPTFILEPRSFLEKLADYYYHSDLLSEAAAQDDPYQRMISVVKFYLSGFYKKPKGLKKPYNPILGETFRCCWQLPDGSTTYYIAEQVSHHPPISSLFVTNRKAGFNLAGTILAKSKYYGNSLAAMMIGTMRLTLLNRGETYTVTLPYANCKGIMIGTLTMELGGEVTIECDRTAYTCNLDFKLKPFIGGSMNLIAGKVKFGKETLAEIDGRWDGLMRISNVQTVNQIEVLSFAVQGSKEVLWNPTPEIIRSRLPRLEIPLESQGDFESKKLWLKVSEAIAKEDQYAATAEKTVLEEDQRRRAKSGVPHKTKYFRHNHETGTYDYVHAEYRPWDTHTDVKQVEQDYIVRTEQKIKSARSRPTVAAHGHSATPVVVVSDDASSESSVQNARRRRHHSPNPEVLDQVLKPVQESLERIDISVRRLNQRIEALQAARPDLLTLALIFVIISILQTFLLRFIWNH